MRKGSGPGTHRRRAGDAAREQARVLAVLGPTATGKTALAMELARRLGGEIISADSRQAYRGLEVGTAAPTSAERAEIPHHGVGFLDPAERYGAGRFARLASVWVSSIEERGHVPIVCGGTGFFFRALTRPIFREPELEPDRRCRLEGWLRNRPAAELAEWTARLDRALAARIEPTDRQRASRALEVALLTGKPLSWWHANAPSAAAPLRALACGVSLSPAEHRNRIQARTERLLNSGWLEEARDLHAAGSLANSPAFSAIGYASVLALSRGDISRDEATEAIVRDTWQYARRQRTWFRHQLPAGALRLDGDRPVHELADCVVAAWRRTSRADAVRSTGMREGL